MIARRPSRLFSFTMGRTVRASDADGKGALSDRYPNLFVPAGFTFAVWGIIYLLLTAWVVFQFAAILRPVPAGVQAVAVIGPLFLVTCLANTAWIFAWHYQRVLLSVGAMLVLFCALIAVYVRLGVGVARVPASIRYLVQLPFSVYLGWITVATIANITAALVHLEWNRFGLSEAYWAVAAIAVATVITALIVVSRRDAAFALVVVWALVGIMAKRMATDRHETWSVVITAAASAVVLIVLPAVRLTRRV